MKYYKLIRIWHFIYSYVNKIPWHRYWITFLINRTYHLAKRRRLPATTLTSAFPDRISIIGIVSTQFRSETEISRGWHHVGMQCERSHFFPFSLDVVKRLPARTRESRQVANYKSHNADELRTAHFTGPSPRSLTEESGLCGKNEGTVLQLVVLKV